MKTKVLLVVFVALFGISSIVSAGGNRVEACVTGGGSDADGVWLNSVGTVTYDLTAFAYCATSNGYARAHAALEPTSNRCSAEKVGAVGSVSDSKSGTVPHASYYALTVDAEASIGGYAYATAQASW